MEKHVEEQTATKNSTGYFYLLGAFFGALTAGFVKESILAAIIGAIVGLVFAGFFVGNLLKGRQHDR